MKDYLVKALGFIDQIRVYTVNATDVVREAVRRHQTLSGSTLALGKALVGGLLLGEAMLKGEDKLTIKIKADGPAGNIIVDANATGEVKGYVKNPLVEIQSDANGNPSLPDTIGRDGSLTVIKDFGLKEPFSGQVELVASDLSQDFTYYLAKSEQIPSAVSLSVQLNEKAEVVAAGGFLIQVLPGAADDTIAKIEASLKNGINVAHLLASGTTPEDILTQLVGTEGTEILTTTPVAFKCDCSKEKFGQVIISLGVSEMEDMLENDHGAEAVCSFCNNHYEYSEDDLRALIAEAKADSTSSSSDENNAPTEPKGDN